MSVHKREKSCITDMPLTHKFAAILSLSDVSLFSVADLPVNWVALYSLFFLFNLSVVISNIHAEVLMRR